MGGILFLYPMFNLVLHVDHNQCQKHLFFKILCWTSLGAEPQAVTILRIRSRMGTACRAHGCVHYSISGRKKRMLANSMGPLRCVLHDIIVLVSRVPE